MLHESMLADVIRTLLQFRPRDHELLAQNPAHREKAGMSAKRDASGHLLPGSDLGEPGTLRASPFGDSPPQVIPP